MSEILDLNLRSKTLEEIIVNPTLWAKRIELAAQEGLDALDDLQVQLSNIQNPVARARECQVFLALGNPEKAAHVIEGETHSLCRAMYLAVKMSDGSFSSYVWVTGQPEILTNDLSKLGLESQMRWDFMRAQSYKHTNQLESALRFYTLSQRIAASFNVRSIAHISETQMKILVPSPLKAKIDILVLQLHEMKNKDDFRVLGYVLYNLCKLYLLDDDYASLRDYADQFHSDMVRNHTILLTDFFFAAKPSATLYYLGQARNQPFCGAGYILSMLRESKWYTNMFRKNSNTDEKLKPILETEVPDNFDIPILNLIMLSVKVMAHVTAEDFKRAEEYWGQMKYIKELFEMTEHLPYWAKYYMDFTEAFLALSKSEEINPNLRESIIEGLGKMKSFSNFVMQLCPELVYALNHQKQDEVLEKALSQVLVITKEGCFLGTEEVKGFPNIDALVKEIDNWYEGDSGTKRDDVLLDKYADRLSELGCKGVVVAWKVEEKMREVK